ncbi:MULTISPECIES: helix-hairpin-helix domain-containing protein [Pseudomonas]|uniref:Competence protein ComEA n=2 Tax=Pseudomonas TaxID=286 RepID=A0A370SAY2_PSEJE|nr:MULTISPECIES: helix-hairpin-helix domain-containing protein [Pseudomonas]MDD1009930.1 helix-hairpin-helix domain-containing protein [Pseudomonas shahriarae]RDL16875.1 competence protein ComEA [Pseudomonas jessenii]
MRTGYFYSLMFALLTSASIAVVAAPVSPPVPPEVPIVIDAAASSKSAKINLNEADSATLQKELSGVGEAKAKAIVAYRETNGPFASVDELLEVKGIGKAILDRNRDKLEVN